jgi:DNA-binding beta-propeller fold protein YncE
MRYLTAIPILVLCLISCEPNDPGPVIVTDAKTVLEGNGIFIMNEGNFTRGNGSLSFYSSDSAKIYNNIFYAANKRTPGDIPFSMYVSGDTACLIINNSGKIEVVSRKTMLSLKAITGIKSPRYMVKTGGDKYYISSLYSDSLTLFSLSSCSVTGFIDIGRSSEQMLVSGAKAYIASWSGGRVVTVVDIASDEIIKTIEVGLEPESMVSDRDGNIWVLCSGGYMGEEDPVLMRIDPSTDLITRSVSFSRSAYPTNLRINAAGDSLYYLKNGVFRMSVYDNTPPVEPLIREQGRLFYRMEPDNLNSSIFVTDANDYQRSGFILRYSNNGTLLESHVAGIIPGNMSIQSIKSGR